MVWAEWTAAIYGFRTCESIAQVQLRTQGASSCWWSPEVQVEGQKGSRLKPTSLQSKTRDPGPGRERVDAIEIRTTPGKPAGTHTQPTETAHLNTELAGVKPVTTVYDPELGMEGTAHSPHCL